jgi:DNA polymerase III epsilon subunit family exonuclease
MKVNILGIMIVFILSCIPTLIMVGLAMYALFTGQMNTKILVSLLIYGGISAALFIVLRSLKKKTKGSEISLQEVTTPTFLSTNSHHGKVKMYVDSYVTIDIQTTGLNYEKHEIVEIGAVKYVNHVKTDSFHTYVKPKFPIPEDITAINGISNSMVSNAPDIKAALSELLPFIGENVLVAHKVSFEYNFLNRYCKELLGKELNNQVVDTLYLAKMHLRTLENQKLETIKKHFQLSDITPRTLDHCEATAYLYRYCCENPVKYDHQVEIKLTGNTKPEIQEAIDCCSVGDTVFVDYDAEKEKYSVEAADLIGYIPKSYENIFEGDSSYEAEISEISTNENLKSVVKIQVRY